MSNVWRRCGNCKKEILLGGIYQKCSISSCRKHAFCSVGCWDLHSSIMNHKSAWAEEERAPKVAEGSDAPRRRIVAASSSGKQVKSNIPTDILIVVSKMKDYVKAKHGMNTSGDVSEVLSQIVRVHIDEAIHKAREEGRKTLMGRDFK